MVEPTHKKRDLAIEAQNQILNSIFGAEKSPIVFDLDLTLTTGGTSQGLWTVKPLDAAGQRLYGEIKQGMKNGTMKGAEAIYRVFELMKHAGITREDYAKAARHLFDSGIVRKNFIDAIAYLAKHKRNCYIASKSAQGYVDAIVNEANKRAGANIFAGGIGSREVFDGLTRKVIGAKEFVGDVAGNIHGYKIVPKTERFRELGIDVGKAVVVSDNIADLMPGPKARVAVFPSGDFWGILFERAYDGIAPANRFYLPEVLKIWGRFPHIAKRHPAERIISGARKIAGRRVQMRK